MSALEAQIHPIGNPRLPQFEGLPVTGIRVRVSGLSTVNADDMPVFTMDDRVRMVCEFKCVGVRHVVDPRNGEVYREQVLAPTDVQMCPFNPQDPSDDGVIRAR